MTNQVRWLIRAVSICLALAGLGYALWPGTSTQSAKIAQQGVAQFRSEMDARQFESMFAQADESVRTRYGEERFARLMTDFWNSLGAVQQTRITRARESWFSGHEKYVTLDYKTTWERAEGEERFVFVLREGRPLLQSYHISTASYPPSEF